MLTVFRRIVLDSPSTIHHHAVVLYSLPVVVPNLPLSLDTALLPFPRSVSFCCSCMLVPALLDVSRLPLLL
jgi:hypothetical protein